MAKPLDDRIAAALADSARAATVADLISEIAERISATERERDRLTTISTALSTGEDAAEQAAADAAKLAARATRLAAKKGVLEQRHEDLLNSERRRRAADFHAATLAERDGLVTELRETWPALVDQITGLLQRVVDNDAAIERANRDRAGEPLMSAEAIVRGCSPMFMHHGEWVPRLTRMAIPALDFAAQPIGSPNIWPPRETNGAAGSLSTGFAEMERAHAAR